MGQRLAQVPLAEVRVALVLQLGGFSGERRDLVLRRILLFRARRDRHLVTKTRTEQPVVVVVEGFVPGFRACVTRGGG